MRDYRLDEWSDEGFENLVGFICSKELGTGTITFAKGRDGGRDGRFDGVAQNYPSQNSPWRGKFIVQAKHTTNPIASCSDNDFEKNKTSVIEKEIPRIRLLKGSGEVDNYLLFTNRKVTGGADTRITSRLQQETGVENVALIGKETLQRMMRNYDREIRRIYHIDQTRGPLIFHSQDLKDILTALSRGNAISETAAGFDIPVFVSIEDKNKRNDLSERYFRHMQARSLAYFGQIAGFLRNPVNSELARQYDNMAAEFNEKILIRRNDFDKFEEVFEFLYDRLREKEPELGLHTRLVPHFINSSTM